MHEPTEAEKSEIKSTVDDKKSSRFSLSAKTPLGRNMEQAMMDMKVEMKDYIDRVMDEQEEKNKKKFNELETAVKR